MYNFCQDKNFRKVDALQKTRIILHQTKKMIEKIWLSSE